MEIAEDDERLLELEALLSIYPELELTDKYEGMLDIAVSTAEPVTIVFTNEQSRTDICTVNHLPPLQFHFKLPKDYPGSSAPNIRLTSVWLPRRKLVRLERELVELWHSHEQVLFSMIDVLTEKGQYAYEDNNKSNTLTFPANLRDKVLSHEGESVKQEFNNHTFHCEICQYKKKGHDCTQLQNCGHVFCTECLKSYFGACIEQGYIAQVICPQLDCTIKSMAISDLETLVGNSLVNRFQELSKKIAIESDPTKAIICPRNFCQALFKRQNMDDQLAICPECQFAFCAICNRSWHGYFQYCRTQEPEEEIILDYMHGDEHTKKSLEAEWGKNNMQRYVDSYESDAAFRKYMEANSNVNCPVCSSPIEKSMGCNKMTCSVCHCFFCYLCLEVLGSNPYHHYGDPRSPCFQRLFEGTEIEGQDEQLEVLQIAMFR